jgi:hypothetical protein
MGERVDLTMMEHVWALLLPPVTGMAKKFRRIGKKSATLGHQIIRSYLVETTPHRDPHNTRRCIYSIPGGCERSYTGQTGRPFGVVTKTRHSLEHRLIEKPELAQYANDEGHRINLEQARVLQTGSIT